MPVHSCLLELPWYLLSEFCLSRWLVLGDTIIAKISSALLLTIKQIFRANSTLNDHELNYCSIRTGQCLEIYFLIRYTAIIRAFANHGEAMIESLILTTCRLARPSQSDHSIRENFKLEMFKWIIISMAVSTMEAIE